MYILFESIVMCFILLLTCVIAISNGAIGGVALYEEEVQRRVVELGLTTKKDIRNNLVRMSITLFLPIFTLVPIMVYFINGACGFWDGFWQMTIILWIMGLFDRIFIDWYWVGHTKSWIIEGTEDLMPYISKRVVVRKWLFTIIGFPLISSFIATIISVVEKL